MIEHSCTLGYHSHTQWLVEPQIILLYDNIEINRPVYNMLVNRGREKRSSLDILLADLLLEYERADIIRIADYNSGISSHDREAVEELLDYWQKETPEEFINLGIQLLNARLDHLKVKRQFVDVTEPIYQEMTNAIAVRLERIEMLKRGEMPKLAREGIKHCLEHVIFTDRVMGTIGTPIFEWPGYGLLRQWLYDSQISKKLSSRLKSPDLAMRRSTEAVTLNAFFDLFVGTQQVTDKDQLRAILDKRDRLKEARTEIGSIHKEMWDFLASQSQSQLQENILDDFTQTLSARLHRLQKLYHSVTLEKEAARRQPVSQIVTTFSSTAISLLSLLVPIPGVADKLSERLGDWIAKSSVERKYPQLSWLHIFQKYARVYQDSLLKRARISIKAQQISPKQGLELRELAFCEELGISRNTLYEWLDNSLISPPYRSWQGWELYSEEHIQQGRKLLFGSNKQKEFS